jgi:hypothetical protein
MLDVGRGAVMSPQIKEIDTPSLPKEIRQFRDEDRFVVFTEGYTSEPMSYSDAILTANNRHGMPSIGFVSEEPAAAPTSDYSKAVPSHMSRRKKR